MRLALCAAVALAACSSSSDRSPELEWNSSRGWEPKIDQPDDGRTHTVPDGTYVQLRYASLDDPKILRLMLTAGKPLRDKAIIAEAEEVCAPALAAAVAAEKPDRLLLRIEGTVTASTVGCLDRLETPRLYLAMCPDDGTTLWQCDGDAELAALAGSRTMARRLRGLAVGFSDEASWKHIAGFAALEYLTVRGRALANIDVEAEMTICRRTALRALDVWDPNQDPPYLERDPLCVYLREDFASWGIHDPPPSGMACRLRHIFVWDLEPALRSALKDACPDVRIESAH